MPKVIDAKSWQLTPASDGRRYSKYPDGTLPTTLATWNLPATINVPAGTSVGVRQYTADATGWTIAVTSLATGLTYNSGTESIDAANTTAASGTATFTLSKSGETPVENTATVSLLAAESGLQWPDQAAVGYTPALRNRRGFGMDTRHAFTGGNPQILRVTNLNKTGPGSFVAAMQTSGNRIIVFETSGTIDLDGSVYTLSSGTSTVGARSNVWIAGQTAPSPGITFINGKLSMQGPHENIFMQHVRIHLTEGYLAARIANGGSDSGAVADCLGVSALGKQVYDHCEFMFSFDEIVEVWLTTQAGEIDFVECLFAYPLADPTLRQDEGGTTPHAFGPLWHSTYAGTKVSQQGCLQAHTAARSPLASVAKMFFANNIMYNGQWSNTAYRVYSGSPSNGEINFVGNRCKGGLDGDRPPFECFPDWGTSKLYVSDNSRNGTVAASQQGSTIVWNRTALGSGVFSNTPLSAAWPTGYVPWANGTDMEDYILANVGARPNDRTPMAQHAVDSYTNGTGRIIQLSTDAGIPGPDTSLTVNTQAFNENAYGSAFDTHATETDRKNVEVYLLDLGEAA